MEGRAERRDKVGGEGESRGPIFFGNLPLRLKKPRTGMLLPRRSVPTWLLSFAKKRS